MMHIYLSNQRSIWFLSGVLIAALSVACEEAVPVTDMGVPAGPTPGGGAPLPMMSGGPAGQTTAGQTPAGQMPAGEIPAGEMPAGEMPAGETPAGETPAGETPAGETPAGETPAGETSAGDLTELCEPGEVLGLCEVCDDDGYASLPDSDPDCPGIECEGEWYTLDDEGQCLREVLSGSVEGYCSDFGLCGEIEDLECAVDEVEVVATEGACQEIISCDGEEPPELSARPNGALCNEWGTCQDGECNVPTHCAAVTRYNQQNFFCEAGETDDGDPTCMFFVNGRGASDDGDLTCNDFCALSGATCVDGWNNANNDDCQRQNDPDGCDVSYSTQVCVCSF